MTTHRHDWENVYIDGVRRKQHQRCGNQPCLRRRTLPLTPCACLAPVPDRAYSAPSADCARCAGSGYMLAVEQGCCCHGAMMRPLDERCDGCQRYEPSAGPIHTCLAPNGELDDHAAYLLTGPSVARSKSATARGIGTSIDAEGNGERAGKAR